MVTRNPLTAGRWTAKHFRATVISSIWPEITFFTLVATMVTLVSEMTEHSLGISNQMLTVLGTVLGLVVSFRTSSAYDRYWEGRKLWTGINLVSRNIASMIWVHVPIDRPADKKDNSTSEEKDNESSNQSRLKAIIEKKTMINLVQAFSVSVKHMLRSEPGIYYEDLYPLVCFLPQYVPSPEMPTDADLLPLWRASYDVTPEESPRPSTSTSKNVYRASPLPAASAPADLREAEKLVSRQYGSGWPAAAARRLDRSGTFNPEILLPTVDSDRPLLPARNPPRLTLYNYIPVLRIFKPLISLIKRLWSRPWDEHHEPGEVNSDSRANPGQRKRRELVESNVPLEITLHLSSYLAWLLKKSLLSPPIGTAMTNNINALHDTIANLDRVRTTPIPFAYQAHLHVTMWFYLFFLPFQIYNSFRYLTIPATAFASFLLLGFLDIGQEIENPFNYDLNDLDLDHFCLVIQRELHEITAHPVPEPDSYIYGMLNQPFAPAERKSAHVLLNDRGFHPYTCDGPFEDIGMARIRRTLLQSWREVNEGTIDLHRFQTY